MSGTEGRVAVITGANRGVGLGLARAYKERGWRVIAICRSSNPQLEELGVEVLAGIDLAQDACVAVLEQHFKGICVSLLVSNAGMLSVDSLAEPNFADALQLYEVNALGPLRVVHALRDSLQPGSKVAIITSKMASLTGAGSGKTGMYGYRMSKAAANMAGRILAVELAQRQVAVVLLHPGAVVTDMFDRYWSAVGKDGMAPSTHGYISVEESVAGIMQRIDELGMDNTGQFRRQSGEEIPW